VSGAVDHVVIVAGGKGERLSALYPDTPKTLVPVGGVPVLQHQLELAARHGVRSATIFAGHLAERISAFVGDGSRFGLRVTVEVEREPLGNAGAVLEHLDRLPAHFFVMYGDVMLDVDLSRMARRHLDAGADFTAFIHPNDHPQDSDLVEVDAGGWITHVHAYPHAKNRCFANLVNAALYVVRRDALAPFTRGGKQDFTTIIGRLVATSGRVLGFKSPEYVKDMGTPDRLRKVEADWQAGRIDHERAEPAVFLDRDGTINVERGFLRSAAGLELVAGAGETLRSLRKAGYRLVLITNQPVIARGEASEEDVADIHRRLEWELGAAGAYLDEIYLCPHHPDAGFPGERKDLKIACDCRKPGTALVDRACEELRLDRTRSWMIGDQSRDIEMARRAGLRSILVRTGLAGADAKFAATPDFIADDLPSAAALVLAEREAVTA
jgi:D,D-heptose 1,7-bisphosphate phosphatase